MQTLASVVSFLFMLLKAFKVLAMHRLNGNPFSAPLGGVWSSELTKRLQTHSCEPGIHHEDTTLLHGLRAGTFRELGRAKDVEVCVLQCCETHHCELALLMNDYCYGITCYSQQHCATVPALGDHDKMVAVFLHKLSTTNATPHTDQEVNQSKIGKTSKKSAPKFVFYPTDINDSKDLAFSINLRNIASHYTDNEKMKKVLTAKADEHLTKNKESKGKNSAENQNPVEAGDREEEKQNRSSALDQFFSRDQVSSARKNQQASHGDTFRRKKNNDVNIVEWNSTLFKGAISSSSVALLIVILILLAISRKGIKGPQQSND